ncbi:hypothetical protein V8B97DRAFT_2005426 [Scleroderma yunnanense]
MGGATSKIVRRLPKEKPSWSGTRTPTSSNAVPEAFRSGTGRPLASETKNEAVEADGKDPQFMAKLNMLGPVRVDHHTIQGTQPYCPRTQSETEVKDTQATRNHLLATALSEFLDARKSLTTIAELQSLAAQYHLDVDKIQTLCNHFNSPSIDESTVVRQTNEEGEESVTMMARWVDPALQHRQLNRPSHT